MAADVTGFIGNEEVQLDNAATESTLRALLMATTGSVNNMKAVMQMAARSGLSSEALESASQGLEKTGTSSKTVSQEFKSLKDSTGNVINAFSSAISFAEALSSGKNVASLFFSEFTKFGGIIGAVAGVFKNVAQFQEKSLESYQAMADSGVSFSGSLSDMRMAAGHAYLSLDEFGKLIKEHSGTFANMGGSASQGAKAFAKFTSEFINSDAGAEAIRLGYSFQDINEHAATYIQLTGGRTAAEMQNTNQLKSSTAGYLDQLDRLAEITGQSRKKQEEDMKKVAMNEAWQNYIAKLRLVDPAKADRMTAGLKEALSRGGQEAGEVMQAKVLGMAAPASEAARNFQVMSESMGGSVDGIVEAARTGNESIAVAGAKMTNGLAQAADTMGEDQAYAASMGYGTQKAFADKALQAQTDNINKGVKSEEDRIAAERAIDIERKKKVAAELENAANLQKAFRDVANQILENLMPIFNRLMPTMIELAKLFSGAITWAAGHLDFLKKLAIEVGLAVAAYKIYNAVSKAKEGYKAGGIAGASGSLTSRDGSSSGKALFVTSADGSFGGLGGGKKGGSSKPETGGKGKGLGKLGGVAGVVGGLALTAAGEYAKEKGNEKTGAGLDIAGDALSGASTGAMLGSLVGPLGTAVGGVLGGLIGGGISAYQNWDTLTGKKVVEQKKENKTPDEDIKTDYDQRDVPKMAEGGIVNRPTSILAGEAGPEAILPLTSPETSKLFKQMSEGSGIGAIEKLTSSFKMPKSIDEVSNVGSSMLENVEKFISRTSPTEEKTLVQLESLNSTMKELVKYMKDTANNTDRTHKATQSLNGNLWAA